MDLQEVLILGCIDEASVPAAFLPLEIRAERTMREAIEARGFRATFIDIAGPQLPHVNALVDGFSGMVLLGGADVDPTLYGLPAVQPNVHGVNRAADEFEIAAILRARDNGIPALCICRGAQVLNVAHGGTLVPDITEWAIHHGPTPENIFVSEEVFLTEGSTLACILGTTRTVVQNGHHQAVNAVGAGLRVAARAADGIIEAVESTDESSFWAVGVQWHPEHPNGTHHEFASLMDEFTRQVASARLHTP